MSGSVDLFLQASAQFQGAVTPISTILRAVTRIVTPYMADVGVGYTYKKITHSRFCHGHQQFSNMVIRSQDGLTPVTGLTTCKYGVYLSDHPLSLQYRKWGEPGI